MGDLIILVYLTFTSSCLTDVIAENDVGDQDIATSTRDGIFAKLDSITKRQSSLETRLLARIGKGMNNCKRCRDSGGSSDNIINNIKNDLEAMKKTITSERDFIRTKVDNIKETIIMMNETLTTKRKQADSTIDSLQQKMADFEMNSEAMKNKFDRMTTSLSEMKQASEDQVSFHVFLEPEDEGVYFHISRKTIIPFNHVTINDGSGYNNLTGVFTTPKSGVYQFTFFVEGWTKLDDFSCETAIVGLAVNKEVVMDAIAEPRHPGQSIISGNTYITYVEKGQKAWIETLLNCETYYIFGYRTSFSGVLLY